MLMTKNKNKTKLRTPYNSSRKHLLSHSQATRLESTYLRSLFTRRLSELQARETLNKCQLHYPAASVSLSKREYATFSKS